jgi:hypothetical protein
VFDFNVENRVYDASQNRFDISGLSTSAIFTKTSEIDPPRDSPARSPNDSSNATGPRDTVKIVQHPNAGCPISYVSTPRESDVESRIRSPHPYWPFEDQQTFNLARWFITNGVTAKAIDELLKGDYPLSDSVKRSFGSNYHLRKKLDMMDDGLGLQSWLRAETKVTWNSNHPEPIEFYHRSPIEVAKWLLMQPYLEDYQTYNPTMRYVNEERHYSDMFEAKYMWDIQVRIICGPIQISSF